MTRKRRFEKITEERKRELEQIMSRSNTIAKQVCKDLLGNRKYPRFRQALRNHNYDGLTEDQVRSIAAIPGDVRATIDEVESITDEATVGMMPLATSVADAVAEKYDLPKDVKDDLVSEGWFILLKAVYGYTDLEKDFGKYARAALWHEFQRIVGKPKTATVELRKDPIPADKDLLVDLNLTAVQSEGLPTWAEDLFKTTHIGDLERQVLLGSAAGIPRVELACLLGVSYKQVKQASMNARELIAYHLGRRKAA